MTVYIGLGSNLGDREAHLRRAIRSLRARELSPTALSAMWETAPVGCREPLRFLNMVARVETRRDPVEVLDRLLHIEREGGRRPGRRNAPRPIDLDLLLAGDRRLRSPRLVVPHPRMWTRRFVLAPLAELDPGIVDPSSGRTVAELERALRDEQPDVRRLGPLIFSGSAPSRRSLDPPLRPTL